jgi:hypothetical protein
MCEVVRYETHADVLETCVLVFPVQDYWIAAQAVRCREVLCLFLLGSHRRA